jgi:hypothetical protein
MEANLWPFCPPMSPYFFLRRQQVAESKVAGGCLELLTWLRQGYPAPPEQLWVAAQDLEHVFYPQFLAATEWPAYPWRTVAKVDAAPRNARCQPTPTHPYRKPGRTDHPDRFPTLRGCER